MASTAFPAIQGGAKPLADINITPLVDVMLVLLVIFMVTMPMRTAALDLTLPGAAPPSGVLPSEPVQLQLRGEGVLLDVARIDDAELPAALAMLHRQAPAAVLRIDSGDEIAYGRFAAALAAGRNAGFRDIVIRR